MTFTWVLFEWSWYRCDVDEIPRHIEHIGNVTTTPLWPPPSNPEQMRTQIRNKLSDKYDSQISRKSVISIQGGRSGRHKGQEIAVIAGAFSHSNKVWITFYDLQILSNRQWGSRELFGDMLIPALILISAAPLTLLSVSSTPPPFTRSP